MKLERITQWAEIFASLAVVVSVIFLTIEVRENTRAVESEAIRDRSKDLNSPFTNSPKIPEILAKIKAVDGLEPGEQMFVDHYGITHEEAAIWARYISQNWTTMEADFTLNGESQGLKQRIQLLLLFPDQQLWFEYKPQLSNNEFLEYIERVRNSPLDPHIENIRKMLEKDKEENIEK